MPIVNFLVMLIMNFGLTATLFPKLHGTVFILATAFAYGLFTNFQTFNHRLLATLTVLSVVAEVGSGWLRILLTKKYSLSRSFCVNSLVGNLGGVVAADCILGKTVGVVAWQLLAGKTFLPRVNTVMIVLVRLGAIAGLRLLCGFIMEWFIIIYILQ